MFFEIKAEGLSSSSISSRATGLSNCSDNRPIVSTSGVRVVDRARKWSSVDLSGSATKMIAGCGRC